MKKTILLLAFIVLSISFLSAQEKTATEKTIPTGWKFGGALPALSYDSDVGFRYGVIGYIYDWGDGSLYPDYLRSIYLEASRTTKGSETYRIQYDDKAFLNTKIRFLGEIGFYGEQALDFYGFNGYQAIYHHSWENTNDPNYKTRMFYRHERKLFRISTDFQLPITSKHFRAFWGLNYFGMHINSVDIDKLNKGKKPQEMLPSHDSVPGLYELYQQWGIFKQSEIHGGNVILLKGGLIYDTRDNEALPTKGLWDDIVLIGGMPIAQKPYLQISITHRQYFTLIKKHLFFAYRLVYSGKIAGQVPYYMLPFYFNTDFTNGDIQNAFGGAKTIRGILRNRIVADAVFFENAELRWRIIDFRFIKQNFYIALSSFLDGGMVLQPYKFNTNDIPASVLNSEKYFNFSKKELTKFHIGYGGGFRIAMNENFIVAVDYGIANNKQDGSSGMYIGLGWLF